MIPIEPELPSMKSYEYLIPLLSGLVGALIGGGVAFINTRLTVKSKRVEESKNEIYKKLNEFYGPLVQLRAKSNLLYQKFSTKYRESDPEFKTLMYLLEGNELTGNEKIMFEEILKVGNLTSTLIQEKAGLIDDERLRTIYFPRATTHFLVLELAYKKSLIGDVDKFKDSTFPRELDSLIEGRIVALQQELRSLK